jgi:hypothetical protein
MANTYSQIYIQIVFAVERRQCLIGPAHQEELQKFMTGIVSGKVRSCWPSIVSLTTPMS